MILRDYQQEAVYSVERGWLESTRQLGVAATGAGKTIMFSHLAARQAGRTLILAHREELINQAVEKLHRATGIFASVERAEQRAVPGHGVIVASVQTVRRRLAKYAPDAFDLIICDEAHRALSPEWQAVLKHFSACQRILGVTATPDRADKKDLGKFFQRIAFEITLVDLIAAGHLAPLRARRLDVEIDVRSLIRGQREISEDSAAEAVNPVIASLARELAGEVWDRKTLVFLPRCDTSERFAGLMRAAGIDARHVDGNSSDRVETLRWFAEPGPRVLCNAMLLTEGFDQPDVDCVVPLRPIRSRALYSQIIGRGTRLAPGKEYCLIIDPLWLTGEHDLCRPACLTGGDKLHRDKLQEQLDLGMDLLEAEAVAKVNVEEALAQKLKESQRKKCPRGMVDPLAYSLALHDGALMEWQASSEWEAEPATAAQRGCLEKDGLWTEGMQRGFASLLIDKVQQRRRLGLATPRQAALLRRLGEPNADMMRMADAGMIIGHLRAGRKGAA